MAVYRTCMRLAGALAIMSAAVSLATAQQYPSRAITIIAPSPAGSSSDTFARIVSDRMRETLGQPIIVENVIGAGGSLAVARAARAAADGYTISAGQWASHVGAGAISPGQYDALRDLEPVALLGLTPLWIVARNDLPAQNLKELIAWLKANPDKASAATVGPGSGAHLCGIYIQDRTDTRFTFVPYRAGSHAMQDIMAGRVDLMCDQATSSVSFVRNKQVKAFAVMSNNRWFGAPDVPTVEEAGVPALHFSFWHGMWVPRGTSSEIVAKLNAAVREALAHSAVREKLAGIGLELPSPEQQTPQALGEFHRAEIAKWWPIIKAAKIKAE
jgi:tripartite-type tricarboxylate transporter receptor subunit TctC